MSVLLESLYGVSLWIIWPVCAGLLVGCSIAGRVLGRRHAERSGAQSVGALETTALGLVTLLLSFTFSAAMSRYDSRKASVVEETNALSTTQNWAKALPAPHRAAAASLLADYIRLRLSMSEHAHGGLAQIAGQTAIMQGKLWAISVDSTGQDSRSIPIGQFAQSMAHLFDVQEARVAAERNHVPESVFLLLFALAGVGLGLNGYRAGLGGAKAIAPAAIIGVLFATVITQVQDLDRPQRGLILVEQQSIANIAASQ